MSAFTFDSFIYSITKNGLGESALLPAVLNMSITASVIIVFVLLVRLLLKKAPKIFSYALWAVVLFRLLCPVSITTDFSLLGLLDTPVQETTEHTTVVEYVPHDVAHTPNLEVQLPVAPVINEAVNDALPQEHAALGADPLEGPMSIATMIWLAGICIMAIYSVVSYITLRRKLIGAVPLRDHIYLADGICSPFVMGFIRPKIYLPSGLSEQEQGYIILHEQHHIRRGDHLIKALAFIALCIHWFNPLVWVAFVLSSKDMEMSCDEAVVKKMGEDIRADYSASLLSLATGRRIIAGTPLAFGEGDTKSRIKNMLNWKKPKVWLVVAAALAVVVVAVLCGTNADRRSKVEIRQTENSLSIALTLHRPVRSFAIYEEVYQDGRLISGKPILLDGFPEDDWSRMPRRQELALYGTVGYDGSMTSSCVMDGAEIMWDTALPGDAYTRIESIVGAGNKEGTLMEESHKISAGDSVILCSIVMSESPDGEVCVYRNGWSLAKANDTVVQYRLVTSTETAKTFGDMPLDLAQTLYDLRVETLNDRDDPGAQEAIRTLLDTMGANVYGAYELRYYDISDGGHFSSSQMSGNYWPGGSGMAPPYKETALIIWYPDALPAQERGEIFRAQSGMVDLSLALIPELTEVFIGRPKLDGTAGYAGSSDKDGTYVKEYGYSSLEEMGQSAAGIRALMQLIEWPGNTPISPDQSQGIGTAEDVSYYLELAAGTEFRNMSLEKQIGLLEEYEDLLDDYTLIAHESEDGKTAYIVGQYNGNPTASPLHGMYSVELSKGEKEWDQFLYREEASAEVEEVLAGNKKDMPPSAGYRITDSKISWSPDSGIVLIQPKDTELSLDVAWSRYLYTPNGREYIADAVSRGIDVCGRTDTFLYVYRISERFGELAERIALTEAEAKAILAEKRVKITDGFGFSASLHIDGQTTYYNEREGIPQTVLDLAVGKCDYRFGDPSYITDTIREARLDCDWLDAPLYADEADLPRLREILKNAEQGYVGSCGYGAKLTLTFTGGEKLTVFKGCDGCDTVVFGSYGGYFIGDEENTEFWEMFGLDPDTKEPLETSEEDLFFLRTGIQEVEAQEFYAEFVALIESDAKEAVLKKIIYPVSVTVDEGVSIVNNAAELLPYYDDIFTDGLWESIQAGQLGEDRADLFANDGLIGAANGAIWFAGTQGVMTIQNPEGWSVRPAVSGITTEEGPSAPPTEEAIHDAIMANFNTVITAYGSGSAAAADFLTEAHAHLATEQLNTETYTFYSDVFYAAYALKDGKYDCVDSASVPTMLTYVWKDGKWNLEEFWTPGSTTSVGNVFPAEAVKILNSRERDAIASEQYEQCNENARAYFATQTKPAASNEPFANQEISWSSPLHGMFERTYETQLSMLGSIDQTDPPFFKEQALEFDDCTVLLGTSLDPENAWASTATAYILFRGGALGKLPLPLNADGVLILPSTVTDLGNGTLSYAIEAHDGTCNYTVNLDSKTVSMSIS